MFIWKEDFAVKVPEIDEQHKALFDIGNKINDLLLDYHGQDSYDEIMNQLEALAEYTKYHFHHEELMMEKYNYPDMEEHVKEHQDFIAYLENLDYSSIDSEQKEAISELLKFVASWIFKHILNTDFMYSEFFVKAMA